MPLSRYVMGPDRMARKSKTCNCCNQPVYPILITLIETDTGKIWLTGQEKCPLCGQLLSDLSKFHLIIFVLVLAFGIYALGCFYDGMFGLGTWSKACVTCTESAPLYKYIRFLWAFFA